MNDIKDIAKITEDFTNSFIDEYERRFFNIPFGNSAWENIKIIRDCELTPGRGYRHLGIRLRNRINALKHAHYQHKLLQIRIEEIDSLLKKEKNDFNYRRLQAEKEYTLSGLNDFAKLVNDAIFECETLWGAIRELPEYSRADFESEEKDHFDLKLKREIQGLSGAKGILNIIQQENEFDKIVEHYSKKRLE